MIKGSNWGEILSLNQKFIVKFQAVIKKKETLPEDFFLFENKKQKSFHSCSLTLSVKDICV